VYLESPNQGSFGESKSMDNGYVNQKVGEKGCHIKKRFEICKNHNRYLGPSPLLSVSFLGAFFFVLTAVGIMQSGK
jgi:hypothetical protein